MLWWFIPSHDGNIDQFISFLILQNRTCSQIPVPRSMIGIVIGKGGEMIKKIQQDSGARIQFKPEDNDGGASRVCTVSGGQDQINAATGIIQELIENSLVRYYTLICSQWFNSSLPLSESTIFNQVSMCLTVLVRLNNLSIILVIFILLWFHIVL